MQWIPIILQVMGWALKFFGASEKSLKKYQEMVERANKEGKLSVESYDSLKKHEEIIKQQVEADNNADKN